MLNTVRRKAVVPPQGASPSGAAPTLDGDSAVLAVSQPSLPSPHTHSPPLASAASLLSRLSWRTLALLACASLAALLVLAGGPSLLSPPLPAPGSAEAPLQQPGPGQQQQRGAAEAAALPPPAPPPTASALDSFSSLPGTLLSLLPGFSACSEASNFTLSAVFGSGMVLQRGVPGRVWGWVGEGCTVTASLARGEGQPQPLPVTLTPDSAGLQQWVAALPALGASLQGAGLHFAASNGKQLQVSDVVWGEVVLCSGQSNMAGFSQHSLYGPGSVASALTVEGVYVPGVFDKSGEERRKQLAARAAAREKEEKALRGEGEGGGAGSGSGASSSSSSSGARPAGAKRRGKKGKKGGKGGIKVPPAPPALRRLAAQGEEEEGEEEEGHKAATAATAEAAAPAPAPASAPPAGAPPATASESSKSTWGGWVATDKPGAGSPATAAGGAPLRNTAEAEESDASAWEYVRSQLPSEPPLPIRVFQVGESDNWATEGPLNNLASPPSMPWQHAPTTLSLSALHFAAVCYHAGRAMAAGLPGVPIGLIESAWGGSFIQSWMPASAWEVCGAVPIPKDGWWSPAPPTALFNTMIAPFAIGPVALGGILFYIGESQGSFNQADFFACALPMLLASWRSAFASPDGWAAVVQMQGWVDGGLNQDNMARARDAQLAVSEGRALSRVATVTAVDCGDPGSPFHSIHPRYKRVLGQRSGAVALAFLAGLPPPRGPVYARSLSRIGTGLSVTVFFDPDTVVGGLVWVEPSAGVPSSSCPEGVPRHTCAWFAIQDSGGEWHNASARIGKGGMTLELSVPSGRSGRRSAAATQNGYGMWPVVNLYNAAGLPAYPWRKKVAVKGK